MKKMVYSLDTEISSIDDALFIHDKKLFNKFKKTYKSFVIILI